VEKRLYQEVESAGWEPNGTFSDHLVIGNKGDLCLIIPSWIAQSNDPVYELHDVERNVSYWVREIPSPEKAAEILQQHGGVRPRKSGGNPARGTYKSRVAPVLTV
jgi:hypothetical protein